MKKLVLSVAVLSYFGASLNAGWVFEDNKMPVPCCHKKVKRIVKRVTEPKICLTCDYSKFPMAQLEPLEEGEHLQPATLRNCGMK